MTRQLTWPKFQIGRVDWNNAILTCCQGNESVWILRTALYQYAEVDFALSQASKCMYLVFTIVFKIHCDIFIVYLLDRTFMDLVFYIYARPKNWAQLRGLAERNGCDWHRACNLPRPEILKRIRHMYQTSMDLCIALGCLLC